MNKQTATFYIDPTAKMNYPIRPLQGFVKSNWKPINSSPQLPQKLYVGPFAIVGEHVQLGERVIIDEYCRVGRGSQIGDDSLIIYRSTIGGEARIGKNCVIGATISENCIIEDNCKIFGRIVHKHENSTISWDHHEIPEPAVTIKSHSFVGFEAVVSGGITIGPYSYICAGSIITKAVPSQHIGFGFNKIIHYAEWKGPLRNNPIFTK
jgi:UDP-3-O-[3-hydroxymyristoyl] glucosamine N-acyltransferase